MINAFIERTRDVQAPISVDPSVQPGIQSIMSSANSIVILGEDPAIPSFAQAVTRSNQANLPHIQGGTGLLIKSPHQQPDHPISNKGDHATFPITTHPVYVTNPQQSTQQPFKSTSVSNPPLFHQPNQQLQLTLPHGPNQQRPFTQSNNPSQQVIQSQPARSQAQSMKTTHQPQPKYDQPKPHSIIPTSMEANQWSQASNANQANQPHQANKAKQAIPSANQSAPSGLTQADRDAMRAMSDQYEQERQEFKRKLRESQRDSEQSKKEAKEIAKLLEESRKKGSESENQRTYLESKFESYVRGTGQTEMDIRSNYDAEMNKLRDELETMRAIANANLQSQDIPDIQPAIDTSDQPAQAASSSTSVTGILKQPSKSPSKSQSSSNLSSGTDSMELFKNPSALIQTIKKLVLTEIKAPSTSSTSDMSPIQGEPSSVEKEQIVQKMRQQFNQANRSVSFEEQDDSDLAQANKLIEHAKSRTSQSKLPTFQFNQEQLNA